MIHTDKRTVRKQKSEELKSHTNMKIKSGIIKERLILLEDFQTAGDIFIYLSDMHEVDTSEVIRESVKLGKNVYCPVIRDGDIVPGTFSSGLKSGAFGIPEPMEVSAKNEFDVIIIPGTAFDKNGNRIGRGGGYFDRFLAKTAGKKIALAFDFQIVDKIDTESNDVPVDMILTEERIIALQGNNLDNITPL
ncbi:MAG: 5-formyltetrahydrofolate cyclo-ligase [archaeon GW2011_AR5]|nr:MAG: 5-formyltetrahydrofolate cyclo-ligase [archaeon GW2011_AR5]